MRRINQEPRFTRIGRRVAHNVRFGGCTNRVIGIKEILTVPAQRIETFAQQLKRQLVRENRGIAAKLLSNHGILTNLIVLDFSRLTLTEFSQVLLVMTYPA